MQLLYLMLQSVAHLSSKHQGQQRQLLLLLLLLHLPLEVSFLWRLLHALGHCGMYVAASLISKEQKF
jgi:hypothetical protein